MGVGVCAGCGHKVNSAWMVCPECGADPTTGQGRSVQDSGAAVAASSMRGDPRRASPFVLSVVGAGAAFVLAASLLVFDSAQAAANEEAAASNTTTSGAALVALWFGVALLALLCAVSFSHRKPLWGSALAFAAAALGFLSIASVGSGIVILIATPDSPLAPNSPTVMTWQVLAISWLVAAVPLVAAGLRVRIISAGTPRAILALAGAVAAWALSLILLLTYVDWWVNNGPWFKHPVSEWAGHIPGPITRVLAVWLTACLLAVTSAFLLRR